MAVQQLAPKRICLREFDWTDFHAVHAYASDPRVVHHEAWGPNSDVETHAFLQQAIAAQGEDDRTRFDWAVQELETGLVMGGGSLYVRPHHREASIGYLLNHAFWRQGIGTEVARLLLDFAFGPLALHRVVAQVAPENHASRRVLEKAGLRQGAHFRQDRWMKGRWRDTLVYACLEDGERS